MAPQSDPQQIAQLSIPSYCIKPVGTRHFLVGGGGGAAKTGVKNELQLYLLTYNSLSSIKSSALPHLRAKLTATIDTQQRCNMNCDVFSAKSPEGKPMFISAVGQDEYCQLYVAKGYELIGEEDELESPSRLSLNFKPIFKLQTDHANSDPYQKCVRFDRSQAQTLRIATGGTDGHVRVWDVGTIIDNPDPRIDHKPLVEFRVVSENKVEVDDLDFSLCGRYIATVSPKESAIWDSQSGKKLSPLNVPGHLAKDFKVRSIRFTNWGHQSAIFIVAFQQRQRTSKQVSYIGIFGFNPEKQNIQGYELNQVCKQAISCLSINPVSHHLAIGTMEGSVYCLNSQLQTIYTALNAHKSFVTSVEFLPDFETEPSLQGPPKRFPGPGAGAKCTILSLSVDQMVKAHRVPWQRPTPFYSSLGRLSILLIIVYLLAYISLAY